MSRKFETRYFDASVITRYVTNHRECAPIIESLISDAQSGKWKIAVTPLVMVEVTRERNQSVDLSRAAVIEQFFENDFFFVREVDADLANEARRLIYSYLHLRPVDALHLAAAIDLKCAVLYSYDDDLLRLDGEQGLRIEQPREYDRASYPLLEPLSR